MNISRCTTCIITCFTLAACSAWAMAADRMKPGISPIHSINPAQRHFEDLAPFGVAVGNARVVVLGEQTHGEGDVYSLKVRLVEYLHEAKGFNVLVMESGLFEGDAIERARKTGNDVLDMAPGNIFFVYAKTDQARPVFAYIDSQRKAGTPLEFATFDSQHSGLLSQSTMVDQLAAFLTETGSVLPQSNEWQLFKEQTQALLKFSRAAPSPAIQDTYFQLSAQAEQCLSTTDKPALRERAAFWRRVLASMRSQAKRFWAADDALADDINQREEASADNLIWLLGDVFPEKKIVIWTHDVHGQKSALYGGIKGTLQRVREALSGTPFYHVYFTAYSGQFRNYENGALVDIGKHRTDSLESQLHASGAKYAFVDLQNAATPLRHARLDGYDHSLDVNTPEIGNFADGVLYIDVMHPTIPAPGFEQ
ncbi:MAG TPA: erythromycin esterase family protein [Burkholderiaceae bacterium]